MARLSEIAELRRLSRLRTRSPEDYRAFQQQQGAMICRYLAPHGVRAPGIALDLGCGLGGYTLALQDAGFRVVSLDQDHGALDSLSARSHRLAADASALPVPDSTFGLVFCASLIEHLPRPDRALHEIRRVLLPGGVCYLSFPPYYSPTGGHQFAPFHLLGERFALAIYRRRSHDHDPGWRSKYLGSASGYAGAFGAFGLHRMTIARARALALASGFTIVDQSVRFLPVNTARWGVLGEFLTWHAQFLLRKRE